MTATRAPRRKISAPDPEPAAKQPEPVTEPAATPEPAASVQPQPEPAATAPVPVLVITRVCSFCNSRRPISELGQGVGAWECLDYQACMERASRSGIYPQLEDELEIAVRESRQGAIR
jgi:hypothetical protein